MNMKKLALSTTSFALAVTMFAACGGNDDKEARTGALQGGKEKSSAVPSGQTPTQVGARPANQECRVAFDGAWADSPPSISEGAKKSKNVVEAQVVDVKPAADIVISASQEPGGQTLIPTQEVTVKVTKKYKGDTAEGSTITLFQTGSACLSVEGDPPYVKGETHLLMLTDGPRGQQRTIAPEGRFKKNADGSLEPTAHGPAADEAKGKKPQDLEAKLKTS